MADFIKNPVVELPDRNPAPAVPASELHFTDAEKKQIADYVTLYPTADGAIMRALWLAQEKFGFLPPEVIKLTAEEVGIPYAQAYGVATFYTQYYKQKMGTHVLDVCTCFSCQVCGGYDMLHYLEDKLGIHKGETTSDGQFTIQEVECLGACGSAPMLQVTNGRYVHNLTRDKVDALIDALREGKEWPFESVTLPQDEDEMEGNRRSDVTVTETYQTPPVSETIA
ncbi:MAG: NAD(P)H-dependent oxidoreductase subunit E [Rhodothermales bacterium]|nr:NAD(P)H-dependent oxidoreductase subunit E [Rhodothermales bacterium]MBO6779108.1 NAD(P)H-dependent oxidoreductase subunit E [Rhodothermales bacterium]